MVTEVERPERRMHRDLHSMRAWWEEMHGRTDDVHLALVKAIEELEEFEAKQATETRKRALCDAAFAKAASAHARLDRSLVAFEEGKLDEAINQFDLAWEPMREAYTLLINDAIRRAYKEDGE